MGLNLNEIKQQWDEDAKESLIKEIIKIKEAVANFQRKTEKLFMVD